MELFSQFIDTCYGGNRSAAAAALDIDPDLTVFVLAATPMEAAARDLMCRHANEIFADRAYNPDATLVDRRLPGALLTREQAA